MDFGLILYFDSCLSTTKVVSCPVALQSSWAENLLFLASLVPLKKLVVGRKLPSTRPTVIKVWLNECRFKWIFSQSRRVMLKVLEGVSEDAGTCDRRLEDYADDPSKDAQRTRI